MTFFMPTANGAVSVRSTLTRLSDVKPEEPRWLAPGRVPYGGITVIAGRPGEGKSQLTLNLAARLSRDGDSTILVGAEDGLGTTVAPRLLAHGANLDHVHSFDMPDWPVFPRDTEELAVRVREVGACLVVVDPFAAHLDPELSSFNDHSLRQATRPLARMARETGVAVVIVAHLRKSREGGPLDWIGGSGGLTGAARSVFLFGTAKRDEHGWDDIRHLVHIKSNLAKTRLPLRCRVETAFAEYHGQRIETSRVVTEEDDGSVKPSDIL